MNKKLDWDARFKRKEVYVSKYLNEIKLGNKKILDLGTGPGEFIKLCNDYKNVTLGIDNKIENDETLPSYSEYQKYLDYCKKCYSKYRLKVACFDLYENINNIEEKITFKPDIINCEATINFIFKKHFVFGDNNDGHWVITKTFENELDFFIKKIKSLLRKNGIFMLSALHALNEKEYNEIVIKLATKNNFSVERFDNLRHKMVVL